MAKPRRIKTRVPVPGEIAARVLYASDRTCCKCEEPALPIQIHHIDENPANNSPENLSVLCFACHDMTQTRGGFGRHLSAAEVQVYRDEWIARVERRRKQADAIIIQRTTARLRQPAIYDAPKGLSSMNKPASDLTVYIDQLPNILADAYRAARPEWDSGTTVKMKQATYDVIETLRQMWLRLATFFPNGHFGDEGPENFIGDYIQFRYRWRYALAEPKGPGTAGNMASLIASGGVMTDLEVATVETVEALRGHDFDRDRVAWKIWLGYWEAAKEAR